MADARFFDRSGPFSLADLAGRCGARLAEGVDPSRMVSDVAPLDTAGADDLTFLDNPKYIDSFTRTRAGACLVHPDQARRAPGGVALLLTTDPYRAYAAVAAIFYPPAVPAPGVSPHAVVDATARLAESVRVEAGAVIGPGVEIGAGSWIGANAVIGRGVVLGEGCVIGAGTTLSHCIIGDRVNLYPGVRVGTDGFGFAMGAEGHLKVPQLGRVIIGDDVEIGANCTIDRGAGPDTVIGAGCKIDNLVQIAHNVRLGRGCIFVAQSGVSGSTWVEDFVAVGGQAGITGHLQIGRGARVGAQSGVMKNVAPGATVGGSPAVPMVEWLRHTAFLTKMVRKPTSRE